MKHINLKQAITLLHIFWRSIGAGYSWAIARVLAMSLGLTALFMPAAAHATGFNRLWNNLGIQVSGFSAFLVLFCGLAGAIGVAVGLFRAWKASDENSRVEPKQIIVPIIIGGCLLAFSFIVNMASESATGQSRAPGAVAPTNQLAF